MHSPTRPCVGRESSRVAEPVPRVVFDTNVLISALRARRRGLRTPPVECLDLAQHGAVELVTSPALTVELVRALSYAKLRVPLEEAHAFGAIVAASTGPGGLVHTAGRLNILTRDPSDNLVLETALAGRADYLVTGNLADFAELGSKGSPLSYRGVRVVTPREFLEALG